MTSPLCSPSRASLLTGQYAHRHGITDNTDRSARSHRLVTFPRLLRDAGYETAFVGKWHMGVDDTPRPGFDHWVSVRGQGRYLDPDFNVDGRRLARPGYFTDILNQYAVDFLRRDHGRPFLLYVSHKAVHPDVTQNADGSVNLADAERFVPAQRHQALYGGAAIPHRPNHGRPPVGKPALLAPASPIFLRSVADTVTGRRDDPRSPANAGRGRRRYWARSSRPSTPAGPATTRSSSSRATRATSTASTA